MRKKREDRYQSAREMRTELRAVLGRTDPLAHAATVEFRPVPPPARASAAPAIDSSQMARAATVGKMTPAGTVTDSGAHGSSRSRGTAVTLAILLVAAAAVGSHGRCARMALRPPPSSAGRRRGRPRGRRRAGDVDRAAASAGAAGPRASSSGRGETIRHGSREDGGHGTQGDRRGQHVRCRTGPPHGNVDREPHRACRPPARQPLRFSHAAPAPSAAPFDASHAHVDWSVVGAGGGATPGAVQRALSRKAGAFTQCYRSGLERRNERIEGAAVLHLMTDGSGNVVGAQVRGFEAMPGVKNCIASGARFHVEGADSDEAWADVQLTFRAE